MPLLREGSKPVLFYIFSYAKLLFKYIQFPCRWFNITTFATVLLSASYFYVTNTFNSTKMKRYFIPVLLFLICILLDYKYISSSPIFTKQEIIPVNGVNWTLEHLPARVDIRKIDKDDN